MRILTGLIRKSYPPAQSRRTSACRGLIDEHHPRSQTTDPGRRARVSAALPRARVPDRRPASAGRSTPLLCDWRRRRGTRRRSAVERGLLALVVLRSPSACAGMVALLLRRHPPGSRPRHPGQRTPAPGGMRASRRRAAAELRPTAERDGRADPPAGAGGGGRRGRLGADRASGGRHERARAQATRCTSCGRSCSGGSSG